MMKEIIAIAIVMILLAGCVENDDSYSILLQSEMETLKNEIVGLQDDKEEQKQEILSKNKEIEELKNQTSQNTDVNNNFGYCKEAPTDIFSYTEDNQVIYLSKYFGIGFIFEGELTDHFRLMETESCGFGVYYVGEIVEPIKTFKVMDHIPKNELGDSFPHLYSIKDRLVLFDMKWFIVNVSMLDSKIWLHQINPYLEKINFQFLDIDYQF